jgi:hypothetical protein
VRHDLAVTIEVRALGDDLFAVSVSPPHAAVAWQSSTALTPTEVLRELSARGCHSTDATDALDASGANWRPVHDAEVLRRRAQST